MKYLHQVNIYTRYHIYVCNMKLVCAYHTAVYYPVQRVHLS